MALRLRGSVVVPQVDLVLGSLESVDDAIGNEIVNRIVSKGFCTISASFAEGWAERAAIELKEFDKEERWRRVNTAIQEGLLGQGGSTTIAEVEVPTLPDEVRSDGEMIRRFDKLLTDVGCRVQPFLHYRYGFQVSTRSRAVVNQAGEMEDEPVELTEKDVMKWLSQFLRHKLMCIVFFGPTSGTLELQPWENTDTDIFYIDTLPGTMVLLRPDLLSHRHYAPGRSYAMSTFFMTACVPRHEALAHSKLIPPAQDLDDWAVNRIKMFKQLDVNDKIWNPGLDRVWQNAMNHMFHKGQMIAVRGAACKLPRCESPEDWWRISTTGPDYVTEVPYLRWDHTQVYDEDREGWRQYKSYSRHASFMDGIDLFDCRMFTLTPNEVKSMDPHQRLILEVGYTALHSMGQRKSTLVNSTCGVYVGCGNTEWNLTDRATACGGAFDATGSALSITSGRFSFLLGLKGPSMTVDTEAASGATAVYLAAEACQKKAQAAANDMGVAIAAHILLSPVWWPSQCASHWLSHRGRCQTFDAAADGYVRADGVAACSMKLQNQIVDGQIIYSSDDEPLVGTLVGGMMNNSSYGANLSAPHGPAEQEVIAQAIHNATISPYDVDAVEAHAAGAVLADAVEVNSICRAHRMEEQEEPLAISAMKSMVGNQLETSSLANFVKTLISIQWGSVTPNVHLSEVNPHMDAYNLPCNLLSEVEEYRMHCAFVGVMARGFGGSNVYLIGWGQTDKHKPKSPSPPWHDQIYYWPGGGGFLEKEQMPERDYKIVGSWSQWSEAHTMDLEEEGVYRYMMTLGENRWEEFQIWLDGDPTRVLHPGEPMAKRDMPVWGPDDNAHGLNWLVDGTGEWNMDFTRVPVQPVDQSDDDDPDGEAAKARKGLETGLPGDLYCIRLVVNGKWRTVSWEKVQASAEDEDQSTLVVPSTIPAAKYYIVGSWNGWECEEMEKDDASPGLWYFDVWCRAHSEEFQILRNADWNQVFYPNTPGANGEDGVEILGPDGWGHCMNWYIQGQPGQIFRVEFQRTVEGTTDERKVVWRRLADEG
eukprot:CAMPEP_0115203272 /NCGR_PEP_ID=MMETSP0270-20121206/18561_1 /TAXON_ID=71861 /ORGANISM="Scrippsiella trochoidea, Strain CCMP3099" /LENGTH=1041 /DNA_ID=CAMNT_0002616721 /DNA_START=40 /DNA_END=3161 /DNA_ORIENTATION=+